MIVLYKSTSKLGNLIYYLTHSTRLSMDFSLEITNISFLIEQHYPLNFAKHRSIDVELLERVKQHLIDNIKTATKFLRHKYDKLIRQEKIATHPSTKKTVRSNEILSLIFLLKKLLKKSSNSNPWYRNLRNYKKISLKQKKEKNHYAVYRLKKEIHQDAGKIYNNKMLYQVFKETR